MQSSSYAVVSISCADGERYMIDASNMEFSKSISKAKKFNTADEAKYNLDDNFIPLSYWIGRNTDIRIFGVYISYVNNGVIDRRTKYL